LRRRESLDYLRPLKDVLRGCNRTDVFERRSEEIGVGWDTRKQLLQLAREWIGRRPGRTAFAEGVHISKACPIDGNLRAVPGSDLGFGAAIEFLSDAARVAGRLAQHVSEPQRVEKADGERTFQLCTAAVNSRQGADGPAPHL
jgi:hypothetical protein